MNTSALVITFLACALWAVTEGIPILQPRCRCTETVSREISDERIVDMKVFLPGPHCKETEVIATVKFRKEITLCLNPNDEWVQKALIKRNPATQIASVKKVDEGEEKKVELKKF